MTTEQKLNYHNNLVKTLDSGVAQKFINGQEFIFEITKAERQRLLIEIERVAMSINHAYWLRGKGLVLKPKRLRDEQS